MTRSPNSIFRESWTGLASTRSASFSASSRCAPTVFAWRLAIRHVDRSVFGSSCRTPFSTSVGVMSSRGAPFSTSVGIISSRGAPFSTSVGVTSSRGAPFSTSIGVMSSRGAPFSTSVGDASWRRAPFTSIGDASLRRAFFSTSIDYDRKIASYGGGGEGGRVVEKKEAVPDPTGRRKKDKVPDGYELIASTDLVLQRLAPFANGIVLVIWSCVAYKFCWEMIPAFVYRSPYDSLLDVVFRSDLNLCMTTALPAGTFTLLMVRMVMSRYLLRLYLNRETGDYCGVFQGLFRAYPHFFTAKEVRLKPAASVWHCAYFLKGKGALLDINEFRNVRDYNQMVRFARKLQP